MFNNLNTPIVGVIENMSNFNFSGIIKDQSGNLVNGTIDTNSNKYDIIDGKININFEIFKGIGGHIESQRLDVPLLSRIPIEPKLASCTDNGTPYVLEHKTNVTECFEDIGLEIKKIFLK